MVWSLERAGNEKTGNPIQFVWKNVGNFKIDGNKITGDVLQFDPIIVQMDVVPDRLRAAEGLLRESRRGRLREAKPIGTGPYMVDKFERNAFLRLKANPNYWGGKPAFENVTIKFVTGCGKPGGRDRVRQLAGDARDPLRGI